MEYDTIKKLASIAVSGRNLESKLGEALRLLVEESPFDQCLIYLRNRKGAVLKVLAGTREGAVQRYAPGEGLVAKAFNSCSRVEVDTKTAMVADEGLDCYRSAVVIPLMEHTRCYGLLYLKSKKRLRQSKRDRALLDFAVSQLVAIFRFSEIISDYRARVNELEEIKEKLAKAEKMIALGDMAAHLAHEIKNPLISIGGHATRLKKKTSGDPSLAPTVDEIIKGIRRLEKIVNCSLDSVRWAEVERKVEDLNEILTEALDQFTEDLEESGIKVEKSLYRGPLTVDCNREEMKIAFDNLIANAIQSMSRGGTLALRTIRDNIWVVAEISDNGGGIDPRYVDRIFNPFFTTRKGGTGLGLPITVSIVKKHRGEIEVLNRAGEGVTFRIRLPAAEIEAAAG